MDNRDCKCACESPGTLPDNPVAAMAYVPFQTEPATYDCAEGLSNGTMFPELNKRFFGGKCCGE